MLEAEYKKEWQEGLHQSEYNDCRFADDKVQFCKDWISSHIKSTHPLVETISKQKIRIASDEQYRNLCASWADKINAIDMLKNIGMSDIVIPYYYKKYGLFTESDFSGLPDKDIIIKCNHGSGWNLILNKQKPDTLPKYIIHKVNEWLNLNYAYIAGYEAQYEQIKPGVIVQPVIINQPTDYGFWCVNGDIIAVSLTRKYGKNLEEYIAFTDEEGKELDWFIGLRPEMDFLHSNQKYMVNMIKPYVKELAKPFDFVRVDMYCVNNKVYFGELTFTPSSGRINVCEK